jgi:HemY protein
MVLRLLGYAVILALIVSGAVWLADHPGKVELEWLHWRLSTSVPMLLALLLLAAGAVFFALKLAAAVLRLPADFLERRRARRREQGFQALSDGLAAVAGGQAKAARKLAGRAEKLLQDPRLTRLLSAQSAALSGDRDSVGDHYQAMRQRPETALAGLRGLLALALAENRRDEAITLAQEARELAPKDTELAEQLFALLLKSGQLAEAQELVIAAGRARAFDRAQTARHRALLLNERARRAESDGETQDALAFARLAVSNDPGFADAALRLSRLQLAQGLARQAAATLEKAWRGQPLPELAAAFAALQPDETPLQRLRRLDRLAAWHPESWVTQAMLGEAALDARLWGQARKYLSAAARRPTAALLGLLAKLETGEYKNQQAAQKWLSTVPAADPAWQCRDCGRHEAGWLVVCPGCGGVDRLQWGDPDAATTPLPAQETA